MRENDLIAAAQKALRVIADTWVWDGVVGNTHCLVAIDRLEEMKMSDGTCDHCGKPLGADVFSDVDRFGSRFCSEECLNAPQWAWQEVWSERAHGPFPSREAALRHAQDEANTRLDDRGNDRPRLSIILGTCHYADPFTYMETDIDLLMEEMDERACDDVFGFWDDTVFELRVVDEVDDERKSAEEELRETLRAWARKWLTSSVWHLEEKERLTIEPTKETSDDDGGAGEGQEAT